MLKIAPTPEQPFTFTVNDPEALEPPTGLVATVTTSNDESVLSAIVDLSFTSLDPPAGLSATPANSSQINLTWSAVPGAASYSIKRSLTSGSGYVDIATGLTSLSYSDTSALVPGTRYYYVVTATQPGSESIFSEESSAVPSDPVVPEDVIIASMSLGHDLNGNDLVSASIAESGLGQFYRIMASPDLSDADSWSPASPDVLGNGGPLEIEFNFDYSAHERYFFRLEAWTEAVATE